jgi:benzoyl-CoA reductase subunit B
MSATPAAVATATDIAGRGRREGARLIRDWYDELTAGDARPPAAYVFVMGSMAELLRGFGLDVVFPEINSLQTAVRHVAHEFLAGAEDYGYSTDICGYVKADVGVQLLGGTHPMGPIPRPALAVLTNACNTYIKWAEIWERMYDTPVFTLDIPATRQGGRQSWPGDPTFESDLRYVSHQIGELIAVCEKVSGVKFDVDRLRDAMRHTNRMSQAWARVIELNRHLPAPFNAVNDGTIYLGVMNALRGTPEGEAYMRDLVAETELAVAHHQGYLANESYRLAFLGVPCYPLFRRFNEMFAEQGGAFATSTYLWFASGGANLGYQYDLDRPLESLAQGTLISVRDAMDSMFWHVDLLERAIGDYALDGIVYHPIKSCRTVSTGLADSRRAILDRTDIPTLFLESDMMDRRVVSEAQLKNRIDAFFENLATRRKLAEVAG